jgi:UDP-glucose 4-epimerase
VGIDLRGARVLVTGAGGFIGSSLCAALARAGAIVRGLDRVGRPGGSGDAAEWVVGDIADTALLRESLEGIDIVYHLACASLPATSNSDPVSDMVDNVAPTLGLLDAACGAGVRRVVFISSGGTVYGVPKMVPIAECDPLDPICAYGVHKLAVEKYLFLYSFHRGLDYRILRVSNPYGVAQVSARAQGVIGNFLYRALHGLPLEIWGDGRVVRDYVHVDDVAEAFLAATAHDGPSRIFNIGSGSGHSLRDVVDIISRIVGSELDVRFEPGRRVDVPANVLDVRLAGRELGWRPTVGLEEGIRDTCARYRVASRREAPALER